MQNMGLTRVFLGLIGIVLALIIFPLILTSTNTIITDAQTDNFTGVVDSGPPNYQATITLTQDLYDGSTSRVTSIISNSGTDTPVAGTYTVASGSLVVTGLNAGAPGTTSRNLVVNYEYDAVDQYTGMNSIATIAPLIIFIGILFGSGVSIYSGVKSRRNNMGRSHPYKVT